MAILFIDDDETGRTVAVYNLRKAGFEVDEAANGTRGLELFDPHRHEVVVTDLKMPGIDGMKILEEVRQQAPDVPVVVITAFGNIEKAVDAMRTGAWDFIEKPFSRDRLELAVRRAHETSQLRRDNRELRAGALERPLLCAAAAMQETLDLVDRVAPTDSAVLVTGESGVGKELVIRRLHARSLRSSAPLVPVNCAAIPANLLEAELFGHVRGAFTGATQDRAGRFRAAAGGTIFLDEVAELSLELQAKLLRVYQEGQVSVIGLDMPVDVDVRIIAATNRSLEKEVRDGRFREDLYYRMNVIRIHVPPLRDRKADIAPLARRFLAQIASGRELELPDEVIEELESRPWRGNVRELQNVCERLAILCPGTRVRLEDLPPIEPLRDRNDDWLDALPEGLSLVDLEARVIGHVLAQSEGNVSRAARALGVPRHVLAYRLEKYGLRRNE